MLAVVPGRIAAAAGVKAESEAARGVERWVECEARGAAETPSEDDAGCGEARSHGGEEPSASAVLAPAVAPAARGFVGRNARRQGQRARAAHEQGPCEKR